MANNYKEEFIEDLLNFMPSDTDIEDDFPSVGDEFNNNENLANLYRQQGMKFLRDKLMAFIELNK